MSATEMVISPTTTAPLLSTRSSTSHNEARSAALKAGGGSPDRTVGRPCARHADVKLLMVLNQIGALVSHPAGREARALERRTRLRRSASPPASGRAGA